MPPKGSKINTGREPSNIERTPEYEGFIKKLEDYHAKRGSVYATNTPTDVETDLTFAQDNIRS